MYLMRSYQINSIHRDSIKLRYANHEQLMGVGIETQIEALN